MDSKLSFKVLLSFLQVSVVYVVHIFYCLEKGTKHAIIASYSTMNLNLLSILVSRLFENLLFMEDTVVFVNIFYVQKRKSPFGDIFHSIFNVFRTYCRFHQILSFSITTSFVVFRIFVVYDIHISS